MPVDLGILDPEYDVEVARVLKARSKKVTSERDRFLNMRRKFKAPAITAKLGRISKQIYQVDQRSQTSRVINLPNELKYNIWSYLDDPGDKLMFALSCKRNAAIFEMLKTSKQQPDSADVVKTPVKKSNAAAPPDKPKQKARTRNTDSKKPSKSELIPILQRLQDWMPKEYRLCYECLRFRSRNAKVDEDSFAEKGGWGGMFLPTESKKMTSAVVKQMSIVGQRCPECCVRKHFDTQAMKKEYKETKKIIEEMVGLNT